MGYELRELYRSYKEMNNFQLTVTRMVFSFSLAQRDILELGLRARLHPSFNFGQSEYLVLESFQIFVFLCNVELRHCVEIVEKSDEGEIGPRQVSTDEVTAVFLNLGIQTLHVIGNCLVLQWSVLGLFDCLVSLVVISADFCGSK